MQRVVPYDNSPAETFNHILKTEFVKGKKFSSFNELEVELMDYINWYNNRLSNSYGVQGKTIKIKRFYVVNFL